MLESKIDNRVVEEGTVMEDWEEAWPQCLVIESAWRLGERFA